MKLSEDKIKKIILEEMHNLEHEQYFDHTDKEGGMAKKQLYRMAKYAIMLHDALDDETQLEAWVQSKLTIASEYLGKVKHYLEYEMNMHLEDPESDVYDHEDENMEPVGCGSEPEAYVVSEDDADLMEN